MIKMTGLQNLYKDMKAKNLKHTTFDYRYNKIMLSILFDTHKSPFSLTILKKYSNQSLRLNVANGFVLNDYLGNGYQILREILEIKNSKENPFSPKDFFKDLNANIPQEASQNTLETELKRAISYAYDFEDKEKIFLYSYIDWNRTNTGKKYTEANRWKTKILYPLVYEAIKDKNISIRYTDENKYEKSQTLKDLNDQGD